MTGSGSVGIGNALANVITAGGAADTLQGGLENDTYRVDGIDDIVVENPGEGVETVRTVASYTLPDNVENLILEASNLIGTGNTLNNALRGTAGDDTLDGAGGVDAVDYALSPNAVTVNLAATVAQDTGGAGVDTLLNVESVIGSSFDDLLVGNRLNNIFIGGAGNDFVDGGAGKDAINFRASSAAVRVDLNASGSINAIGEGLDTLLSIETVFDSPFNDVLWGSNVENALMASGGNDTLLGRGGRDVLTGGVGADRFDYDALTDSAPGITLRDVITDFSSPQRDKIDLSGIDADVTLEGDQTFSYIGSAPFTAPGQVRFAAGVMQANVDGAVGVDFEIQLFGVTSLAASDFIF